MVYVNLCNIGYGRNKKKDWWIILRYGQYVFCVYLLSYGWGEFASCTWVRRLLFRSVVLNFVDLGGGGERHDVCCSVLTCITVNRSGDLVWLKLVVVCSEYTGIRYPLCL